MVFITRRETFNAAHKLFRSEWSQEQNEAVFGKCAYPNWHGHNYNLYVTVKGKPDSSTGYVMDLKILGEIIKTKITDKLDHRNINLDVDFMKGIMASTENLAIAMWNEIEADIKAYNCALHSIRLHETENNYVEYFGDSQ